MFLCPILQNTRMLVVNKTYTKTLSEPFYGQTSAINDYRRRNADDMSETRHIYTQRVNTSALVALFCQHLATVTRSSQAFSAVIFEANLSCHV